MIARTDDPAVAFAIREDRMTAALHEYLTLYMAEAQKPNYRKDAMARIAAAAAALGGAP